MMKRFFCMAIIVMTTNCIDFTTPIEACRAGQGACAPELLIRDDAGAQAADSGTAGAGDAGAVPTVDAGTVVDAGVSSPCDGGSCPLQCSPACRPDQACVSGECVARSCVGMTCGPDQVCLDDRCTQTSCVRIPCDGRFTCVNGSCVPRACATETCSPGLACFDGGCVDVSCTGVRCDGGVCTTGSCRSTNPCEGKAPGATCGTNQVCNPSGQCMACTANVSCVDNPNPGCFEGLTVCTTGLRVCRDGLQAAPGTQCGGANEVCNPAGTCITCESGRACTTNPSACRSGVIACDTGAPVCTDGAPKNAGVSCGTAQVCDGAGFCGLCTANEPCTTNPNACFNGITDCTTGLRRCVNGNPKAAGSSCGTGLYCDSSSNCSSCTPGGVCSTNPGAPCLEGKTECSSGHPLCVDTTTSLTKTFYRDADKDGYGNPADSKVVCGRAPPAPSGYVDDRADCCDLDKDARPNQTNFFTTPNGCGRYDYDCSGAPDFEFPSAFTGCTFTGVCAANGLGYPCGATGAGGWGTPGDARNLSFTPSSSVPACGDPGNFVAGCDRVKNCSGNNCSCGNKDACEFDVTTGRKQACR